MTSFVDSAYAPTLAQVKAAVAAGYGAWGFYLAGPGALHNWTPAQVAVLRQGGITLGLPIFVPRLDLTGNPQADAQAFVSAMTAAEVYGAGVLDTEASMRGNAHLETYVNAFVAELRALGVVPIVYGGGNYMPAGVAAWWIESGIPPTSQAYQHGDGSLAGLSVDYDTAGTTFPFATLGTPAPPIPLPAPTVSPRGDLMLHTIVVPTDANGDGYVSTTIPWSAYEAISMEGSDPDPSADDKYFPGSPHVQDRNGFVLASVTGFLPNTVCSVYILATE